MDTVSCHCNKTTTTLRLRLPATIKMFRKYESNFKLKTCRTAGNYEKINSGAAGRHIETQYSRLQHVFIATTNPKLVKHIIPVRF